MRLSLVAAAALVAFDSAALACSCIATDDPAELKRFAAEAAADAVALVEVEIVRPYDHATGQGEVMRVIRTIAGEAATTFQVPRQRFPSSASCDIEFRAGQRELLILYPTAGSAAATPAYRISGLCTDHLLDKPVYRDAVIDAIGRKAQPGDRG